MEMRDLVAKYDNEPEELSITVCGHSLGSALATLSAYDLAESGFHKLFMGDRKSSVPVTVFSFAGPRVGNSAFKKRIEEIGVKVREFSLYWQISYCKLCSLLVIKV